MKKQISSLEMHFLITELKDLIDSKIDKIYNPDKETLIFSLYKTNFGKKILKINIGQSLFVSDEKEDYGETIGFGMLLRKHLDGYFLFDIEQIEPERIVKFSFKIKDTKKYLYIEFFGKGNAILCDEEGIIINSLEHHEFKDRSIKPKIKYKYPISNYNLFKITKKELSELFKKSTKNSLVKCLATELGLGGVYSEEICILSKVDKELDQKSLSDIQINLLYNSIQKLIERKIDAKVVIHEDNVIDAVAFEMEFYKDKTKKSHSTFSEALLFFYSNFKEIKETESDKRIKGLRRIIAEQETAIEHLKKEEIELREKGELMYHKYGLIKEILDEMNKASKKYSWKEIKEKLKEHKVIKEIKEKDKKITIEID